MIRCRLFISRNHRCLPEKGSLKTLFLTFSHFSGSFFKFFSLILFLFFFLFYCFIDGTMPTVNFPKLQVLQIINVLKCRNLIKCPKTIIFSWHETACLFPETTNDTKQSFWHFYTFYSFGHISGSLQSFYYWFSIHVFLFFSFFFWSHRCYRFFR